MCLQRISALEHLSLLTISNNFFKVDSISADLNLVGLAHFSIKHINKYIYAIISILIKSIIP